MAESAQDRRYAIVSLLLAVAGGFADAGSYVVSASFTGHITGNLVLTAVDVVRADWRGALSCALAVLAFLAGSAAGLRWERVPGRSPCRHVAPLLAIELVLIALGMALGPADHAPFLVCVCLAMGVQNGAVGETWNVSFHTTFMTGLTTSLLGTVVAGKPGSPKRQVLPAILGCFIAGAFAGALAASRFGIMGFAGLLVLLAAALAVAAGERVSPA